MATDRPAAPSVLVYGAGAVGSLLGGRLAAAGWPVTLLGRPALREAVTRAGLAISDPRGTITVQPATATSLDEIAQPPDLVLLAVKAYAVEAALPDLGRLAGRGATIVTLQNGVGVEERLIGSPGLPRLVAGSLTIPVASDGPGQVRQESARGGLTLAPIRGDAPLDALVAGLTAAGVPASVAAGYRRVKWSKLLLNLLANAIPALLGQSPAEVYADRRLFQLERAAFIEALGVMRAGRLRPMALPGFNVPLLARVMALPPWFARRLVAPRVARGRGGKRPSLWLDVARGGPTEAAWLNGGVAREAARLGRSTPVNAALAELVDRAAGDPTLRRALAGHPDRLLALVAGVDDRGERGQRAETTRPEGAS